MVDFKYFWGWIKYLQKSQLNIYNVLYMFMRGYKYFWGWIM